jgi:PAS domain S-box-containing protein
MARAARRTGGRGAARGSDIAFEALPFSVIETTRQGRILRMNALARRLLGISKTGGLAGKALAAAVFARSSRPDVRAMVRDLSERGQSLIREGLAITTAKGRCREVLVQAGRSGPPKDRHARLHFALTDVTASVDRCKRLAESEAKWFSLIESAPDIILLIDKEFRIRFINRVPGGKPGQVLGLSILDFVLPQDRSLVRRTVRDIFLSGQPGCYECRGMSPAGRIGWYAMCVGPVRSGGKVLEALLIARDISQMKQTETELRLHRQDLSRIVREKTAELSATNLNLVREIEERKSVEARLFKSREGLRSLSSRLQESREEERTALARDIHDEIGSALTGLKMSIDLLGDRHMGNPQFRQMQDKLKAGIDETMMNVRDLITRLRPPILDDLGLGAAIAWQARVFGERTGITCRVEAAAKGLAVTGDRATALFRVFQELLTNIARHAGATEVKVRLQKEAGTIALTVEDNGRGMPRDTLSAPGSMGLLGIQERLAKFGGSLRISRPPGGGARARVLLPAGERAK